MIEQVRTWDRSTGEVRTLTPADCRFGYRTSRFKTEPGRFVVLAVRFELPLDGSSAPIRYAELAGALGVELGARVPLAEARAAVLAAAVAQGHGARPGRPRHVERWVVLHEPGPRRHGVRGAAGAGAAAPRDRTAVPPAYPAADGSVKTSAAWLIERAGFARGYGNERVRLSSKHTLALTNRGSATTADLLALAAEVQNGVADDVRRASSRFEPVVVGVG